MDLVLGLSMTSTAFRWVLVEGTTGEGASIDRGALDIAAAFDADGPLDALLDDIEGRLHVIGVTWTSEAEATASALLQALAARGLDNVVAVSEIEAADVLARGIADIAGYDDVAVCIVEPDVAVVATVGAEGVAVDRSLDVADVVAMLDLDGRRLDAIFVVGSGDLDPIVSSLDAVASSPVISAAEADLALARGAAVASAQAANRLDAQAASARPHWMSRVGALNTVLAAAVVTFLVSLSVALGLRFTANSGSEQPQIANAADEPARVASAPSVAQAAPQPPSAAPTPPPPAAAPPPVAETSAAALPGADVAAFAEQIYEPPAAPVYEPVYQPPAPPPAAPPPAPAYVPPAPAYVPPPPQPRLRDRIIERIPIINRFHEPDYQYPR